MLMLLDSAGLYYRAFHGVPESITAPDGTPVNAVRGFLDMCAALVASRSPTGLVACWDEDWRPAWRVDLLASYKAHRVAADVEQVLARPVRAELANPVSVAERRPAAEARPPAGNGEQHQREQAFHRGYPFQTVGSARQAPSGSSRSRNSWRPFPPTYCSRSR